MNEGRTLIDWRAVFWIVALIIAVLLFHLLSAVMMPFVAGMALGYLLNPVANWLERLGLNRLGATLLILVSFILAIGLFAIFVGPLLGHQLAGFLVSLPDYVAKLEELITNQAAAFTAKYGGGYLSSLGLFPTGGSSDLQSSLTSLAGQGAQTLAALLRSLWNGGTALVSIVSLLVITPVVAFYLVLDWDKMVLSLDELIPLNHRDTVRALLAEIDRALGGFLRGQSLVCLFLGLWYGLGLSLVGLNFGFLIGISAGILSFVPYVGSLTALVLGAAVATVQGWPHLTLLFEALGVVVTGQFLEGNILTPKLVGESIGLHPVWLIFALLAFSSLLGFTGLLIAVPVAAAIGVLLRFGVRQYLHSPIYLGRPEATPNLVLPKLPE
ncbi:MAG: AI-2E family transporter [Hyphomicrobiales bacterium]|nr:AI-2E family transporter [Hyphomicrobiales bacterium]MDE2114036.1 AI-2E family transporter [Hyphomicrobiales bacterium]